MPRSDVRREAGRAIVVAVQRLHRIPEVAEVAERVRAALVPDESGQLGRELTRDLGRAREVLVLLLAQPRERVSDVDAAARRVGAVRAPPW